MADMTGPNASTYKILDRKILLLDGGLGTTLEDEQNVEFSSEKTPLWSSHLLISSPETLLKVQTDFANAGADVILTATYQASYNGMSKTPAISHWDHTKSPSEEARALLTSAVSISKNALERSGRPGLVALSLGAYGATLIPSQEYTGDYGDIELQGLISFHFSRVEAFIRDDAAWREIDIIAFETLPRLEEIRAVREAMAKTQSATLELASEQEDIELKPYWISCVFPNEDNLPDGSSLEDVVKTMLKVDLPRPYAIGINCTKMQKISRLVKKFEEAADKLGLSLPGLVIYPDGAGSLIYDTSAQKWVGDGSGEVLWDEQVFQIVKEVSERSRWSRILVGGCCKTTPRHIAKLRRRIDDWSG